MPFTETQMKQVFGTNLMDFAVSHGFEVQKGGQNTVHGRAGITFCCGWEGHFSRRHRAPGSALSAKEDG